MRDLIKGIYGYNLIGDNKNFQSYTISHLWGQANNPLFFTNLCNLALIPDWINHLMDKYSTANSVKVDEVSINEKKALTIVNTVRKIALKYYDIPSLIQGYNLNANDDFPTDKNYIKSGTYNINVIMPQNSNGVFDMIHGRIVRQKIKI